VQSLPTNEDIAEDREGMTELARVMGTGYSGTPYQKVLKREMLRQAADAAAETLAKQNRKSEEVPKEIANGNAG
jgi:hypothetical protein